MVPIIWGGITEPIFWQVLANLTRQLVKVLNC